MWDIILNEVYNVLMAIVIISTSFFATFWAISGIVKKSELLQNIIVSSWLEIANVIFKKNRQELEALRRKDQEHFKMIESNTKRITKLEEQALTQEYIINKELKLIHDRLDILQEMLKTVINLQTKGGDKNE